jgi:hypothetical protein
MAATLTQTLASAPTQLRRTTVNPATSHPRPWAPIAWFALAVALLAAMIPGLAGVPVTSGTPRSLTAPVVRTATEPATVITDPTPEPHPQPAGA